MKRPATHLFPFLLSPLVILLAAGCGGGHPVHANSNASGDLSGVVFMGPVAGATVTAVALDDTAKPGSLLASAITDGTGAFTLSLPPYTGHLLLTATSGSYTEEAAGTPVQLASRELDAIVPDYTPGTPGPVAITPISHFAAALTRYSLMAGAPSLDAAASNAWSHLNAHFGGIEWRAVVPTDVTAADGGLQLSDSAKAGLLLAFLSQESVDIATRAGVTPGSAFSSVDFVAALAEDLGADGYFDGQGRNGPLLVPTGVRVTGQPPSGTLLDGNTVRQSLAFAGVHYLANPLDATGLSFSDVFPILNALASDSDPAIFRTPGVPFSSTAPALAFVGTPPLYTNQSAFSFQVTASATTSGVAYVYVRAGQLVPASAMQVGSNVWQYQTTLPVGPTVFSVWAVDEAGNSGENTASALTFTITYDNSPPQISIDASATSYTDERGMTVVEKAPGVPMLPPRYAFPPTSHPSPIAGADVYKAATRLSWGATAPLASELDTQDFATLNVPYLVYTVAYDAQVDSPITSVTYTIGCSNNCGGSFASTTGSLLPDTTTTGTLRYLLPISLETVPGLSQLPATTTLAIQVSASDAAGNLGTRPIDEVFFHVIGPPLSWTEDAAYSTDADAHSAFPYAIADGTYVQSFNAGSQFAPDGFVRLVRYLVSNPEPIPVALGVSIAQDQVATGPDTWAVYEAWNDQTVAFGSFWPKTYGAPDRSGPPLLATLRYGYCDGTLWPCAGNTAANGVYHPLAYSGDYECHTGPWPVAQNNAEQVVAQGIISGSAYQNPLTVGGETTIATLASNGSYVVPAATATAPGRLVVYLNRGMGTRTTPLVWQDLNWNEVPTPAFENWMADWWVQTATGNCVDQYGNPDIDTIFSGSRWYQLLASARTQLTGSFSMTTQGLLGNTTIGEPQLTLANQSFSRSFNQ